MKRLLVLLTIVLAVAASAQDMIVRVHVSSPQDLKRISTKPLDIAAARRGEWYDLVADQELLDKIIGSGLIHEIRIPSLAYEKERYRAEYLSYAEVNDSLRHLVQNFPQICKLDSLPIKTYQGNWIYGVKISDNPAVEDDGEPGFLIDGLHHSREWACIPVVLFFADSILRAYGTVPGITGIINNNEIYCFPLINVDGYLYDYPAGNMWRKDREPAYGGIGNDPNRNYPSCAGDIEGDWGAVDEGKASHNNTSSSARELFCGRFGGSGEEVAALMSYAQSHQINAYMSYHSYSELVMWSWGWTAQATPDATIYSHIGNRMADLVQRLGGGTYGRGPIYTAIYGVSGGSVDWLYSWSHYIAGIPNLAFTTELGTAFYQPEADLNNICHQNFKALECLANFADTIMMFCEGTVPAPGIASLGTVQDDFSVAWSPRNPAYNDPSQWELVELANPSVIEDDLESGTGRWLLDGFTLSTSRAHSSSHSLYSGSADDTNCAVTTIHPYLIEPSDSLTFWCWYNLETNWDVAVVEISMNKREWQSVDTIRFTGNSGAWVRRAYSLAPWAGLSGHFRFRVMTDEGTHNEGFYVDDIAPVCLFSDLDTISSAIADTFYQFTDHPLGEYYYYVRGYNTVWGWGDYSMLTRAQIVPGIIETTTPALDRTAPYFQVHPNPFASHLVVDYQPAAGEDARLKVYDSAGRLVRNIGLGSSGGSLVWNCQDEAGRALANGVYLIEFNTGDFHRLEKAILLK